MRRHRTHEIIVPWNTGAPAYDASRLAAVRIEPVLRQRRPALALDLYLCGDGGDTVVPLVLVDPAVVIERDRDPLVFPFETPAGDRFALGIAERVLPHLEQLILRGERVVEHVLYLTDAPRFRAAREAGCFGAAPLRDALARLAPYRYARRFVRGRSVRIDAPDATGGWAMLRNACAAGVAAGRRDAATTAWYGDPPIAVESADVCIAGAGADPGDAACVLRLDPSPVSRASDAIEVIDPLPLDVGLVFDPAEGPVRRWFVVERAPEPVLHPVPVEARTSPGTSAGRIALIAGRADAQLRPSADADEAAALALGLAAEGFDVVEVQLPHELDGSDLVHVVGTREGRRARAIVERARRAGIPVAVHAYDEDAAGGGWWGAEVARYCFEYGSDEADLAAYLGMLADRAVSAGEISAAVPYAPDLAAVDDASAALREASLVFVATDAEADALRRRTGRRGPIHVVAPLAPQADPAPVGRLVGSDRFALVHAPIGPLANQLLLARCAAEAAVPLVVAGPVADASYLERVREFGGAGLVVLAGEPRASVAAALRASAGLVADAAWVGDGGSRLAAAALAGARLVIAERRRFDVPGVCPRRFDPADAAGLTRALGEAWDEVLRGAAPVAAATRAALSPPAVVRSILRAYATLTPTSV
ncbi:MAG TPA: hypothetical protein VHT05_14045 [Candidatus Elarobacter sp.]|nr:hypothetical protein [Candidatus Elarobacter sp.]